QENALKSGVDIVVATPGRLVEHIRLGNLSLSNVKHFVLDEADRMVDMGFINEIKGVIANIPAKRQYLMFTANVEEDIRALCTGLRNHS
ncbi:DEAD/DEAH box helicase, partial [Pseudoalteromonas sp. S186]|uniref:DEAD/DEAH box helicase n=1 Tax=Pseudoalteromonas sp. S186 TaxID=2066521 RepID=UPI00110B5D58